MKKPLLLFILGMFAFSAFSQDEDCLFSDGNYYFQVLLVTEEPPGVNYNGDAFITHLETNNTVSEADAQFLEDHLIDVYSQYPYLTEGQTPNYVAVISDDPAINAVIAPYIASINPNTIVPYCDCEADDGSHEYYARVIADEFPSDDYNKTDFINHIIANSNPTDSQLDFLDARITEVRNAFQGAQSTSLRNTLMVTSDYDIFVPFLHDFQESFNLVEYICNNATLSTQENDISISDITIVPNPIADNSIIHIDGSLSVEELFIYDITGKLLDTKVMKGLNTMAMNEFQLNRGIYFLKFVSKAGHTITKKIIVR